MRLMLEDAGIEYENSDKNCYGPTGSMDMFRGSPEAIHSDAHESKSWPTLFPPAIHHRPKEGEEVLVNQVGACMIYLGDKLGYAPSTDAERARANSVLMNAIDYIADGRMSFHPVKNTMSYHDQKEEGDRVSKEFTQDRMKKYLYHFNKVVVRVGSKSRLLVVLVLPMLTLPCFMSWMLPSPSSIQISTTRCGTSWMCLN